ncbi:MAG: PhpK family radical SAM P-methyltransferase [Candidatus Aminicenantes bacterium]|nr:MAG: PhpK family radical SAM P-methyltransferase [Candidatus Aminicenantes bacterium]
MKKKVDCFLIGHNEMQFEDYERSIRIMGVNSGAYRDLNMNFIRSNNKLYSASDIFNELCCNGNGSSSSDSIRPKPVTMGSSFSATVAYLGTYLYRRGLNFDYVSSFQDEKEYLAEKLAQEDILTIAITTTFYVSSLPILEIMEFIKKYNRDAKIIVGGPFVSAQVRSREPKGLQSVLRSIRADFYVNSSQGEATLVKLIRALKEGGDIDKINNLYYMNDEGYVSTPVLKEDNPLSENMVKWDLFADRVDDYVMVRTSRSCPFACSFCGFPQHAGKYQTANLKAVEEELNLLDQIESLRHVDFVDDTFNVPPERFKEIVRMIIKNRYKFLWHSQFRCQYADREMVELMKESGCKGVFLGIESGNNQILKNMNKAVTVEKYLKGIELLKEYGILTFGCFIVGFPGETDETIRDTFNFIEDSGLDFFRTQLWFCDPITPIWEQKEKYDIQGAHFKWSHATMDFRRGCDFVEQSFLSIKNSTWVPQYNFEFDALFHLMNRGMTQDQVKLFLKGFNSGIREKLTDPSQKEAGSRVLETIKKACGQCKEMEVCEK